jgi:hypothetical protein
VNQDYQGSKTERIGKINKQRICVYLKFLNNIYHLLYFLIGHNRDILIQDHLSLAGNAITDEFALARFSSIM